MGTKKKLEPLGGSNTIDNIHSIEPTEKRG